MEKEINIKLPYSLGECDTIPTELLKLSGELLIVKNDTYRNERGLNEDDR